MPGLSELLGGIEKNTPRSGSNKILTPGLCYTWAGGSFLADPMHHSFIEFPQVLY